MKELTTMIYGLCDESGNIRYIGKTSRGTKSRLKAHISLADKASFGLTPATRVMSEITKKDEWIICMLENGAEPSLIEIGTVKGNGGDEERAWIKYGEEEGWELTNTRGGSEGLVYGKGPLSEEVVRKYFVQNGGIEGLVAREKKRHLDVGIIL